MTVRRHVGLFYLQRFITVRAVACRACGRRLVRNFTLRTLVQGWWGMISFFFNWFVLGANTVAWLRLGRLNEPSVSGTDGLAIAVGSPAGRWEEAGTEETPKPKGRSRLGKGGAVAAVAFVGLALFGIGSRGGDASDHDHSDPHGQPMTAFGIKQAMVGKMFRTETGERVRVESADCTSDAADALQVHFQCQLLFNNGEWDDVLVHVLRDGLFFRSSRSGGA